jgi:hypothetical protein
MRHPERGTIVSQKIPDEKDVIWIVEAQVVYKRSRKWLSDQVKAGKLHSVAMPGTAKVFLLRKEVEQLLSTSDGKED